MNKDELLNISQDRKAKRKKDKKTERQTDKMMNDDEQDSEDIKTIREWQYQQDFLIYWTQWSIDLDDLLIQNEWSNIGVSFIWDDPVYMTMW